MFWWVDGSLQSGCQGYVSFLIFVLLRRALEEVGGVAGEVEQRFPPSGETIASAKRAWRQSQSVMLDGGYRFF